MATEACEAMAVLLPWAPSRPHMKRDVLGPICRVAGARGRALPLHDAAKASASHNDDEGDASTTAVHCLVDVVRWWQHPPEYPNCQIDVGVTVVQLMRAVSTPAAFAALPEHYSNALTTLVCQFVDRQIRTIEAAPVSRSVVS